MKKFRHHNPNQNVQPLSPDRVERLLHGAPLPDILRQERLAQARQESPVPDIKTALEKALSTTIDQWVDDEPQNAQPQGQTQVQTQKPAGRFAETVGVSRSVFNFIRDNPGIERTRARRALIEKGFNKGSVDALVSQYVRAGIFSQTDTDALFVTSKEYTSLPSSAKLSKLVKARARKEKANAKAAAKAAQEVDTAKVPAAVPLPVDPRRMSTADFLESLSVAQAKDLYDELKKIFGG